MNGSSVNRLGLSKFKSASVLSLRSPTLTRATFQHNGGSELKLLALWHCESGNSTARSASTELSLRSLPFLTDALIRKWTLPPFRCGKGLKPALAAVVRCDIRQVSSCCKSHACILYRFTPSMPWDVSVTFVKLKVEELSLLKTHVYLLSL